MLVIFNHTHKNTDETWNLTNDSLPNNVFNSTSSQGPSLHICRSNLIHSTHVFIDQVRSNTLGAVGFLGDSRRMNVAITRARKHVAVVCDSSTICHNTFLARLLRHIRYFGRVKHAAEPGTLGGSGLGMNPMLPFIT